MSDFETCPVGTAKRLASLEPQPIVLPSLDEVREVLRQSEGRFLTDAAQAVLDLIASRVPVWVPVEPGTVKPGMVLKRTDRDGGYTVFTVKHVETYGDKHLRVRGTNGFYVDLNDDGFTWEVDPATVPAEPEDPRVDMLAKELYDRGGCEEPWQCCPISIAGSYRYAARDILARLDALEADR